MLKRDNKGQECPLSVPNWTIFYNEKLQFWAHFKNTIICAISLSLQGGTFTDGSDILVPFCKMMPSSDLGTGPHDNSEFFGSYLSSSRRWRCMVIIECI